MKETPIIPLLPFGNSAFPFKIETIQNVAINGSDSQNTVHNHNYYELIWLTKGAGTLYADLQEFRIGKDTIFCMGTHQAHRFELSTDMEGYVFSFTDSFFNSAEQEFDWTTQIGIFQVFSQSSQIHLPGNTESLKDLAALMLKEYERRFSLRTELLKRYFRIFLMYLEEEFEEPSNTTVQSREAIMVRTFMEMLDKNFKDNKMVADYAQKLYVTPNYLNRVIKKNTGFSVRHHIKQRVVLEAKRLGRYSNAGMKQIAYSLGFTDSAHFSKFFKSGSGTNFSEFKNVKTIAAMPLSFNRA